MKKILVILLSAIFLFSFVSAYSTTATITSNEIGQIRDDFYGTNTHGLYLTNYTGNPYYNSYQNYFLESNMEVIYVDLNEDLWSNTTTTGDTYVTLSSTPNKTRDQVEWAYNNGKKVMFLGAVVPNWLQNRSSDCSTYNYTCPPLNYTRQARLQLASINYYTNNGAWMSAVSGFSPVNEPHSKLLRNLGFDNFNQSKRMQVYYQMFNASRTEAKSSMSSLLVGGPSGHLGYGTDNVNYIHWDWWFGNMTNNMDFIDVHVYRDYDLSTRTETALTSLYANCTAYGGNCSQLRITEFNVYNDTVRNVVTYSNIYQMQLYDFYSYLINQAPRNISSGIYNFAGEKWSMVNGTDNTTRLSFNVTKFFATNHKAGNDVLSTTATHSDLKIVASKDSTKTYITLTNTNATGVNVTLNVGTEKINLRYYNVENNSEIYTPTTEGVINLVSLTGYEVRTFASVSYDTALGTLCNPTTNAFFQLIIDLTGVALIVFVFYYGIKDGIDDLDYQKILMLGIGVIVGVILLQVSADNLNLGACA